MISFEEYLIVLGTQLRNFCYDFTEVLKNIEYFRECYDNDVSVYNALDKFIEVL